MTAPKFDGGKSRTDLVAADFILAVGDVLAFGAKKYEAWSWAKGKPWSRDYAAALRHLLFWQRGEDRDPESGLPHLAHAAADIMFILVSQARGLGEDDRQKFVHQDARVDIQRARDSRSTDTSLISGDCEPR